ncbi:MAG TPA: prolyl oligopeptidase family serine peptidase, partial [Steroidobacteraceae bacterium]|nr:prolyl oligopeptidase family serine peptidase [Steroidobacteraceae bacterium]
MGRACARRGDARATACAALGVALAVALPAATQQPQVQELDEVTVTARVARPLEDFVEFPRYDSVAISPGGTHVALGWTEDNFVRQVSVTEFPSMKPLHTQYLQIFLGVSDLRWANERQLLIQPDWPLHGFLRLRETLGSILFDDFDGRHLQQINPIPAGDLEPLEEQRQEEDASGRKKLNTLRTNNKNNGKQPEKPAEGPVRLIEARTGTPDEALFQTTRTDRAGDTDGYGAFRLSLQDGRQSRVALLPLPGGQIITGPEHRVALVCGVNAQNERVVYYLPPEARAAGKDWQLRVRSPSGERGLTPVAWTGNGEEYYALDGRQLPTRAVVVWNAADDTERVLYRDADVDMDSVSLDPKGMPWMFSGTGHFPVYWYPDPGHPLAQLHQALVQKAPREQVDVMNATDDLATAVVRVGSARRPPIFLLMDVASRSSLKGMYTYPKLHGTRLSPVDAIEFQARDGLRIRGYLTTPLDADDKPDRQRPLLVIAHDGPGDAPSDYRYEYERQLFASRGYAVLEVNHRGSSGRGVAFERAGDGKWGREVQDDYADAVRWAIQDGVAADGHVCFYGTGFGAYSAMTAAARAPDLFQCVVGVAGVYDLPDLYKEG